MIKNRIKTLLNEKLSIYHLEITDNTYKHKKHINFDGAGHFELYIVSDDFVGLELINRHKMIYNILKNMIKKEIHALFLMTITVKEFLKLK